MSAINNKLQGYYKPEQFTSSKIIIVDVLGNQVDTKHFEKQLWSNKKKSAIAEGKALWYGNTTGWKKVPMAELFCCKIDFHGRGFQASGGFQGFARFLYRIRQNLLNANMFPPPPENGRRFPWKEIMLEE